MCKSVAKKRIFNPPVAIAVVVSSAICLIASIVILGLGKTGVSQDVIRTLEDADAQCTCTPNFYAERFQAFVYGYAAAASWMSILIGSLQLVSACFWIATPLPALLKFKGVDLKCLEIVGWSVGWIVWPTFGLSIWGAVHFAGGPSVSPYAQHFSAPVTRTLDCFDSCPYTFDDTGASGLDRTIQEKTAAYWGTLFGFMILVTVCSFVLGMLTIWVFIDDPNTAVQPIDDAAVQPVDDAPVAVAVEVEEPVAIKPDA